MAAKAEGNPPIAEYPAILQHLFEARFQLRVHWETKEAGIYNLVVSKPGKLREADPGDCPPPGSTDESPCGSLPNSPGNTRGRKLTADELAGNLSFFVQKSVVNKTNLTGRYDIELHWTPDSVRMQTSDDPTGPSIFTALQEQLGLKLEASKGPVKMLVIDQVEKPSDN